MEHQVDWEAVRAFEEALKASPQVVQEAFEEQRLRWNDLLFRLADLNESPYDGETSDELIEAIAARLARTQGAMVRAAIPLEVSPDCAEALSQGDLRRSAR